MNILIGDIDLEHDGVEYILRPSFKAISNIEISTNKDINLLFEQISKNSISKDDIEHILYFGINAGGNNITKSFTKSLVNSMGYYQSMLFCARFLDSVIDCI